MEGLVCKLFMLFFFLAVGKEEDGTGTVAIVGSFLEPLKGSFCLHGKMKINCMFVYV